MAIQLSQLLTEEIKIMDLENQILKLDEELETEKSPEVFDLKTEIMNLKTEVVNLRLDIWDRKSDIFDNERDAYYNQLLLED